MKVQGNPNGVYSAISITGTMEKNLVMDILKSVKINHEDRKCQPLNGRIFILSRNASEYMTKFTGEVSRLTSVRKSQWWMVSVSHIAERAKIKFAAHAETSGGSTSVCPKEMRIALIMK